MYGKDADIAVFDPEIKFMITLKMPRSRSVLARIRELSCGSCQTKPFDPETAFFRAGRLAAFGVARERHNFLSCESRRILPVTALEDILTAGFFILSARRYHPDLAHYSVGISSESSPL